MDANTTPRALVTVMRYGEEQPRDLELPADLPVSQLVDMIAAGLQWHVDAWSQPLTYRVEVQPLGHVLAPGESLAQAGVWDGAFLVFYPLRAAAPAPQAPAPQVPATLVSEAGPGPLRGWRPLTINTGAGGRGNES